MINKEIKIHGQSVIELAFAAATSSANLFEVLSGLGLLDSEKSALVTLPGMWFPTCTLAQQPNLEGGVLEIKAVEKHLILEKRFEYNETVLPIQVLHSAALSLLLDYAKIVSFNFVFMLFYYFLLFLFLFFHWLIPHWKYMIRQSTVE